MESLVFEHQKKYDALQQSMNKADSAPFIEFMLRMILNAVSSVPPPKKSRLSSHPQAKALIEAISDEMSRDELQTALNLKDRKSFRGLFLKSALEEGVVEMTIPDKPKS